MALYGSIRVNGKPIGIWTATRVKGSISHPGPNHVLTYYCTVEQETTLPGCPAIHWHGQVNHRFGDGAVGLAAMVLATAFTHTRSTA